MRKAPLAVPRQLVVIGASAGGVAALQSLLRPLPPGFAVPVVAVLHLLPRHGSQLAAVLGHDLALPVREPLDKEALQPATVYVAGADYHLLIEAGPHAAYSSEPPVQYARPSIDVLMTSAAAACGPGVVGVLLTGANMDGAEGLAAIHAAGGVTVVQDPQEAAVATMPAAAIARCRPDHVLPLRDMPALLVGLAGVGGHA